MRLQSVENKEIYKKRGPVENFFAMIERYPCIINNYEKTQASYMGLLTFVSCIYLAKKINVLISEKNNVILKEKHEFDALKKKDEALNRKQLKYVIKKKNEILKEEDSKIKKAHNAQILDRIEKNIQRYIDYVLIKKTYDKHIRNIMNNNKIANKFSFDNYKKHIVTHITDYVKNNKLSRTEFFIFAKKTAYIVSAPKYAFNDDTIKNAMIECNDIINQIDIFTNTFFDYGLRPIERLKKSMIFKSDAHKN
jgi:hypothetical protein